MNLERECEKIVSKIKHASWFPYQNGTLRDEATDGKMIDEHTYLISFSGSVAPYVQYLEEGTQPHDIPGAFGKELPFGIGGRFDGKFHPGSTKHKGFISVNAVNAVIDYFVKNFDGEVRWLI